MENQFVTRIAKSMRTSTCKTSEKKSADETSRKNHIENALRNIIRVMKFVSPDNKLEFKDSQHYKEKSDADSEITLEKNIGSLI